MLDQLLGHSWHIRWFPREYVSVGPKKVVELEFLFVTQSCSDDGCFGVITLLQLDSLSAHTIGWFNFLEGIDSLSESSLAAASILLTELGTRIVEA